MTDDMLSINKFIVREKFNFFPKVGMMAVDDDNKVNFNFINKFQKIMVKI